MENYTDWIQFISAQTSPTIHNECQTKSNPRNSPDICDQTDIRFGQVCIIISKVLHVSKNPSIKKSFVLAIVLHFLDLQHWRTSTDMDFPLRSASSSLSSSLSFLMQSKYSFCLSKAWSTVGQEREKSHEQNKWKKTGHTDADKT